MNRLFTTLKEYFIPHEGNDHQPHILRVRNVAFVCLVAIVVESVFLVGSSYVIPRPRFFGTIMTNALIDGTNEARAAAALPALKENALLTAAAQKKANDMAANHYFAHTSPTGVTPWYWFSAVGYNFLSAGENLAMDFTDSQDVTTAWLNSPGHRANILSAGYTEIGMAIAEGELDGRPTIFVAELFATPVPTFAPSTASAPAAPKPVAVKPAPPKEPVVTPVIVATGSVPNVAPEPIAVAIKGAQTTVLPVINVQTTTPAKPADEPAPAPVVIPTAFAAQANPLQTAAVNPRRVVDLIYFAIALLFAVALALNTFIKIRIQHPQVILGGMLVILVAGLLIVMNQHFGATSVAIL